MVRGDWGDLGNIVHELPALPALDGVKVNLHCHFLRSNANDIAQVKPLARILAKQIVAYCIPRSEIEAARSLDFDEQVEEITRLTQMAQELFTTTQPNTGEGGELLLYSLLEKNLGAPQILSKMSLKTSSEMQIHGVDGVHAKLLDNGDLAVYWGEAKMYKSVQKALSECFDSLAPYLLGESDQRDVFLLQHYLDAGNDELTSRLLEYFDDKNALSSHVEVRGACLIGFSHSDYPVLPKMLSTISGELDVAAKSWGQGIKTRVMNRKIEGFEIEVFCVPVPSISDFRKAILKAIKGRDT
jgi:hypothetical protein